MSPLGSPIAAGRTAEIFPWENDCVLKLTRPEFPGHLADQEWRQADAAWKLGAPVPRPVKLVEVEGRRGVVFANIQGLNMNQAMQQSPWRLDIFAKQLGGLHARLHQLESPGFPSLHGRIQWNLNQASLLTAGRKAAVLALLEQLPDENTLCHGDFHPENILLASTGPVVIDWEGSMHGPPAGDVATTCLWIRTATMTGSGPGGWFARRLGERFEAIYLSAYQQARGPVRHLERWLAILAASRMNEENRRNLQLFEKMIRCVIPAA